MASPIPLPTNLKVLRGTAQPCRMNNQEPRPTRDKVKMPSGLTRDEKKYWRQIAADLEAAGILTRLDVQGLRLYCRVYTGWLDANHKLDEYGPVIKAGNGSPVLSPYVRLSQKYFDQLLAILREFGMTPSSRSRIHASKDQPQDDYEAWQKKRRMAREGV